MSVTPKQVRKALAAKYGVDAAGEPNVTFYRSPSGYYYFMGRQGMDVGSLMQYNLDGTTLDEIMRHVADELEGDRLGRNLRNYFRANEEN